MVDGPEHRALAREPRVHARVAPRAVHGERVRHLGAAALRAEVRRFARRHEAPALAPEHLHEQVRVLRVQKNKNK